jgi:hypothetical protein
MFLLLLFAAAAAPAPAAEPEAVVKRAIAAHGGADRLARLRQVREQTRGTLLVLGTKIPFTSDTIMRTPGQFRSEIVTEVRGRKLRVIQVLDGPRGWLSDNGTVRAADATTLADWREVAHASHVAMLTPLLARDKGYTLTALGEEALGGRKVVGVKVAVKGRRDVRLWFDKENGLLVKKSFWPRAGGKEAVQDEVYEDFKVIDGVKRPTRFRIYLGGKEHARAELTSAKFLDRIDDNEFAKP